MKPRVYVLILLLLLPFQGALLAPLSRLGLSPDLGLAVLYPISLLTGPVEGALAGVLIGLLQDTGSSSLVGFSGLTHGIAGLIAGLLGQRVFDIRSPSNALALLLIALGESLLRQLLLDMTYGSFPLLSLFFRTLLPSAVVTAAAGYFVLRGLTRRGVLAWTVRRELRKER